MIYLRTLFVQVLDFLDDGTHPDAPPSPRYRCRLDRSSTDRLRLSYLRNTQKLEYYQRGWTNKWNSNLILCSNCLAKCRFTASTLFGFLISKQIYLIVELDQPKHWDIALFFVGLDYRSSYQLWYGMKRATHAQLSESTRDASPREIATVEF